MENTKPSARRKVSSGILAALMLAACAFMCVMTLREDGDGLINSLRYKSKLSAYLPAEGADAGLPRPVRAVKKRLDLLSARVRSLDSEFSANLYGSEALGQWNATLQYAIGKRLVSTGSAQMVRLNGGYLYDLQEEQSMAGQVEDILALRDTFPEDLPFLFVYEHPTLYDDAMLPPGYEVLDFGEEAADEATGLLRENGVPVIDSRDVLPASGYPLSDFLMYTDQHWTTFAALVMSEQIADWGRTEAGLELDPALLDPERFQRETYPRLFLGKYGQRVGTWNVDPDDITVFWPEYDTEIYRYTTKQKSEEQASGAFREAAIRWDKLERDKTGWNKKAYFDYGLTEKMDHFVNPKAPDITILLFKDSYSAPIGAFLSLTARHVYSVDLRQAGVKDLVSYTPQNASADGQSEVALEFVRALKPDMLVISYSQQMLRDRNYAFVE